MYAETRKTKECKVWLKEIRMKVRIHDKERKQISDSTVQQNDEEGFSESSFRHNYAD